MIVKDEEEVLARCLNCAKAFADEIIIVDTGSTDKTVEIAKQFTNKIYRFDWCDDFSAARNFSFSKAECGLVMWLDADDVIEEEDCKEIILLKDEMKEYDMAMLLYAAAFDGDHPTYTYFRERIFKRSAGFVWQGAVHEAIAMRGRVLYSEAKICHKKVKSGDRWRNLNIYRNLIASGKVLTPRDKFYYGRELMFNGLSTEAVAVLQEFLNGQGWAENKCEACLNLSAVYSAIGKQTEAEEWAAKSFLYGLPKSRACCALGEMFLNRGDYSAAIFWYKTAATLPQNIKGGGFCEEEFCGYVPFMQLCVLYDRLGDHKTAEHYNELAGAIKPSDKAYLYNAKYFANLKKSIKSA